MSINIGELFQKIVLKLWLVHCLSKLKTFFISKYLKDKSDQNQNNKTKRKGQEKGKKMKRAKKERKKNRKKDQLLWDLNSKPALAPWFWSWPHPSRNDEKENSKKEKGNENWDDSPQTV